MRGSRDPTVPREKSRAWNILDAMDIYGISMNKYIYIYIHTLVNMYVNLRVYLYIFFGRLHREAASAAAARIKVFA